MTIAYLYDYYDKRMKKITTISAYIFLTGFFFIEKAFAQAPAQVSEPLCPPGNFANLCNINANSAGGVAGTVIQLLLILAIIISLFFLIFGGIRYVMSGGDKGKVAQARSTLVAALAGLIISLLGFFIVNLILIFFTGHGVSTLSLPKLYNG